MTGLGQTMKKRFGPLVVLFVAISIMGIIWLKFRTPEPPPRNYGITGAENIQIGMTLEEVETCLRRQGKFEGDVDLDGIKSHLYTWANPKPSDGWLEVMFQDGKVVKKMFTIP